VQIGVWTEVPSNNKMLNIVYVYSRAAEDQKGVAVRRCSAAEQTGALQLFPEVTLSLSPAKVVRFQLEPAKMSSCL
jgi:hypothetical protein